MPLENQMGDGTDRDKVFQGVVLISSPLFCGESQSSLVDETPGRGTDDN